MAGITFRSQKGSNLTANEVDDNFRYPFVWSSVSTFLTGMTVRYAFNDYECISDVTVPGTNPAADPLHWKLVGSSAAYNVIQSSGSSLPQRNTLNIILPSGGSLTDVSNKTQLDLSNAFPEKQTAKLYDYSDTTNLGINLLWSTLKWPTGSTFLLGKTTGVYNFYLPTTGIQAGWQYDIITKTIAGPNNFNLYESANGDLTGATVVQSTGLFFQTGNAKLTLIFNGTIWKIYAVPLISFSGFGPTIQF